MRRQHTVIYSDVRHYFLNSTAKPDFQTHSRPNHCAYGSGTDEFTLAIFGPEKTK